MKLKIIGVLLVIFVGVFAILYFLLPYTSHTEERVPKFEKILNTTVLYNVSANLDFEIGMYALPYHIGLSLKDCRFLYLVTNNITIVKCKDFYIKKQGNFTISCYKYQNEWNCETGTTGNSIYNFNMYNPQELLKDIISHMEQYKVLESGMYKLDGRVAYCYNMSVNYKEKTEGEFTGNMTVCFDKQTQIPILIKVNMIKVLKEYQKTPETTIKLYYRLSNLIENPKYEDYKDILYPPVK